MDVYTHTCGYLLRTVWLPPHHAHHTHTPHGYLKADEMVTHTHAHTHTIFTHTPTHPSRLHMVGSVDG